MIIKHLDNYSSDKLLANISSDKQLVNYSSDKHLVNYSSDKNLVNKSNGKLLVNYSSDKHLVNNSSDKHLVNNSSNKNIVDSQSLILSNGSDYLQLFNDCREFIQVVNDNDNYLQASDEGSGSLRVISSEGETITSFIEGRVYLNDINNCVRPNDNCSYDIHSTSDNVGYYQLTDRGNNSRYYISLHAAAQISQQVNNKRFLKRNIPTPLVI